MLIPVSSFDRRKLQRDEGKRRKNSDGVGWKTRSDSWAGSPPGNPRLGNSDALKGRKSRAIRPHIPRLAATALLVRSPEAAPPVCASQNSGNLGPIFKVDQKAGDLLSLQPISPGISFK